MARKSKKDAPKSPFSALKKLKKTLHEEEIRYTPEPKPPKRKEELSDDELFEKEMRGTKTIPATEEVQSVSPAIQTEGYQPQDNRVDKQPRFRTRTEGGTIEGALVDLGPKMLRRLKRGKVPIEDRLDLHGSKLPEARARLVAFIKDAVDENMRCVLVVHGKGHHSSGGTPVLKNQMHAWLCSGELASLVLAYVTAQPADGGTGAIYLMLRRSKDA